MKNFLLILLGTLTIISANAQSNMGIGMSKGKYKCGFTYPDSVDAGYTAQFPSYELIDQPTITAVEVDQFYTYVTLDTISASATINVTTASDVTAGALLWINFIDTDNDSDVLTFGTGINSKTYTITDSLKHIVAPFFYDGSTWIAAGTPYRVE
ncbi:MAG: hypothetical protein AB7G44_03400 [Bacteroidia bacterium]